MKRQAKKKSAATGNIRIIAGQWRGRKLPVLDGEGLRPTTDRTKETLFNWLAPYIAGSHCLDAFAGSGSLGFEALSRRAASVTFVELFKPAAEQLQRNCQLLGVNKEQAQVINSSAADMLATHQQLFDVIFVDPPFHQGLIEPCIGLIEQHQRLRPGGLIYIESELALTDYPVPANWQLIKQRTTKQLCYRLYQQED